MVSETVRPINEEIPLAWDDIPRKLKEEKELHYNMKKAYRFFAGAFSALTIGVLSTSLYFEQVLPDRLYLPEGQSLSQIESSVLEIPTAKMSLSVPIESDTSRYSVNLRMFGAVSVKDILVQVVPREYVIPAGMPFGIKMFTDGVMVVGMTDVICEGQTVNPAKDAGIQPGDVITEINGKRVATNEDVARLITDSQGEALTLLLCRDGKGQIQTSLIPVLGEGSEGYRAGMWVRDSSAGIGTLTFIDPAAGIFAGLGHAVCDIDTGNLMPLYSGEAVNVTITGVTKGESGHPGELRGAFSDESPIGILIKNDVTGIYGLMNGVPSILEQCSEPLPTALRHEVKTGKAYIRATVAGEEVQEYEINIDRVTFGEQNPTRNMVIRITDSRLLATTGGIVQGMSGSPIIQDGKIVGAVTHVLVNDPTRGYGIFIENMLEAEK